MSPIRRLSTGPLLRVTAAAVLLTAGLAATGCGSDDATSSTSAGTSTGTATAPSADGDRYLAEAQRITKAASDGLVLAPPDTPANTYVPPAGIRAVTGGLSPKSAPPAPTGKSLALISCGVPSCDEAIDDTAKVATAAGFKVRQFNKAGKSDQQTFAAAFDSAIAFKPDAILGLSVAPSQVADQLNRAKKAGILTLSASDASPTGGANQYDVSAAASPTALTAEVLGWSIVADSGGKADAIVIKDETFPAATAKMEVLARVVKGCSGCVEKTIGWQITDATDSAKAANIISGAINGNPKADVLVLPYSSGAQAAVQAVAASGRKIKIYTVDSDPANLASVRKGAFERVGGSDLHVTSYQSVDQIIRGLAKQPFVQSSPVAHLFGPGGDVPESALGVGLKSVDYAAGFERLWKQP